MQRATNGRSRRLLCAAILGLAGLCSGTSPSVAAAGPKGDLDQCANGKTSAPVVCSGDAWLNGNLHANNSRYAEGQSVPFRLVLGGLIAGQTYTVDLEFDTVHGNAHAYDYVTSYDRTETTADPCGDVLSAAVCVAGPATTPIVRDDQLPSTIGTEAGQVISVWNGTSPTFAYGTRQGHGVAGANKSNAFRVTFVAAAADAVVAWGGHAALAAEWSPEPTASTLSGSQYHMRLKAVDGKGGNQDRSLKISPAPAFDAGTLTIEKTGPATAVHGAVVNYLLTVTYAPGADGSPAQNIAVTDPLCTTTSPTLGTGDTNGDGLLQGSESWTYTCTRTIAATHDPGEADPVVNTAAVSGEDLDGDPVAGDDDTWSVDIVHTPGTLAIVKTADRTAVRHGEIVTYGFAVTHEPGADGSPAASVVVNDPACTSAITGPTGDDGDGWLEAEETFRFSCIRTVPEHIDGHGPLPNTATADALDLDGDALPRATSDEVSLPYEHAGALSVEKRASAATAVVGDVVTYTYAITNPGDGAVSGLALTDDRCAPVTFVDGDTDGDGRLDPGETWRYRCLQTMGAPGSLVNIATATGTDELGVTRSSTGSATVEVSAPTVVPASGPVSVGGSTGTTGEATGAGEEERVAGVVLVDRPAAAPAAAVGAAGAVRADLPRTGTEVRGTVWLALALMLFGASLSFLARVPMPATRRTRA